MNAKKKEKEEREDRTKNSTGSENAGDGSPRLRYADRQQVIDPTTIDQLIEADHPARLVWSFLESLDLSSLYDSIRSRGLSPGRPAFDPRVLVALWLYAFLAGITSARLLSRLCLEHAPFRWLAGGLSINYHTLSDFRFAHPEFLELLFKSSVDRLRQLGLVDLARIAQDGVRVRASAGAASFRREETLERLLHEAQLELEVLRERFAHVPFLEQPLAALTDPQPSNDPHESQTPQSEPIQTSQPTREQEVAAPIEQEEPKATVEKEEKQKKEAAGKREENGTLGEMAAQWRHAKERTQRVKEALERMPEKKARKAKGKEEEARGSTTDPEARVMKMADGGYRPAYNLQFATTCEGKVIVGVGVETRGSDQGQMPRMVDQIEERFKERPKEELVDGGYVNYKDIEEVQKKGTKVYGPVGEKRERGAREKESKEVAEWRKRMASEEAKTIYKQRGETAEWVNAQMRNHGLQHLFARGVDKVRAIGFWFASVVNLRRAFSLLHCS